MKMKNKYLEKLSEKERGEKRYTSVNYTKPQAPKKKNHSGKCDGDCRNCPPHYGYRHGRSTLIFGSREEADEFLLSPPAKKRTKPTEVKNFF